MSKGFFCVAQGDIYVRAAYALALSIKNTQSVVNGLSIGITPGYKVPIEYVDAFDKIIEIPWSDLAADDDWKLKNEWKCIFMSPYDETIKLDADMLFFADVSCWWDCMEKSEIVFTTEAATYRGCAATSDYYRKVYTQNDLPNVYSAFFYFKKTPNTYEFFKLSELMFMNWLPFAEHFLDAKYRPAEPSTDVVYALAAKILNIAELNNTTAEHLPTFVHMKTELQKWTEPGCLETWTKHVNHYFTPDCSLYIDNFKQQLPFHYHLKDFLTDEIISYLKDKHYGS